MPTPIPRPASAVMTGRPMATTDPKASSMMRIAAVMPMPSLGPGAAVAAALIGAPPSSTWKPRWAAACAVVITFLMAGTGMSAVSVVNWTWAKAMLPLLGWAIWCAPAAENGLVTLCTQGSGSTLLTTLSIAASLAAPAIGDVVWKTMSAVSPDFVGNVACKMFVACCDGVFPAVNLFSKWVPTICATTVTPMMARIHRISTVRRRS